MFKRIDSLHFWCNKILPLIYDDSLSYYETLCKVSAKLNEVINDVNGIPEYIAELLSEEKLKEILSTLLNQLEEQIASANEGTSKTATEDRNVGEWVWLNGYLYEITHNMIAGDQYVSGSNCKPITIEGTIKNAYTLISNLTNTVNNEAKELDNLQTSINEMFINVKDYGAVGDGINDDTEAFENALANGGCIYVPNGSYIVSKPLAISKVFTVLIGSSAGGNADTLGCSKIVYTGRGNFLTIPTFMITTISNLLIVNKGASTNNGVVITNVDYFNFNNVHVTNFYYGFRIDGSSYGNITNCNADRCYGDGFFITSNTTLAMAQVNIKNCLSELNNGVGFHFYNNTTEAMPVANFEGNKTFANSNGGVIYEGSLNHKITGIYISNCFLGGDGIADLAFIECGDFPISVNNCYFEQAGMENTGRNFDVPAKQLGNAIKVNNSYVSITGCNICTSAEAGVAYTGGNVKINGCDFYNCGVGSSINDVQRSGVLAAGAKAIINGCSFRHNIEGANGVYVYNDGAVLITSNDFSDITHGVSNIKLGTIIRNNINQSDN